MRPTLAEDTAGDDPLLSLVNLIDVFLILVAALLLAMAANPLHPWDGDKVTVIRNPGKADMEIVTRDGDRIERFKADGRNGQGKGVKAGAVYRLGDGSLVYVPE